ncbi:MAG: phage portal protein, partial [Spartobacteria bacterium]|nr:phage portal protein [Spartobacteria bacterium]
SLQDLKYNTVELQNRSYYDQTLMPYLERIEAAFDTHFELWDRNRYVEFDTNALLRADIATRYKAYSTGRQWGWLSANDVLRDEHKNEIGPQGDIYMVPANMMAADKWLKEPANGDD